MEIGLRAGIMFVQTSLDVGGKSNIDFIRLPKASKDIDEEFIFRHLGVLTGGTSRSHEG